MNFLIKKCNINVEKTDCIIISVFNDRKLSTSAKIIDEKSDKYISKLLKSGDISGEIGQSVLLYDLPNISSKRVLLIGCGEQYKLSFHCFKEILKKSISVLKSINVKTVVFCLTELNIKKNNIYWNIRTVIYYIKELFYVIKNISKNSVKKRNKLKLITLNVLKEKNISLAKIALQHSLAITYGIKKAKDISNMPPNICNPLYLFSEAKKLTKKYKNYISVEAIGIKEMKSLGMNAYISVGNGSKNQPLMSIIKYSNEDFSKKNVIALVGKGLTFDSGGISIKPSKNMHIMKYDMCGAAAVYGTIIAAAELKLPLTIIGILAGCENMPSGNAFKPGDVLTTLSGKTVEILNTDAEGRLVLCDVLTYIERFSPNIVIDIATLTGACITALGDFVSGVFTNNESLFNELNNASKETNDLIWRLPLFDNYQKELKSNIADFSNVGSGKAGAITAACFLSNFTKKYNWAHLDIAGTAWKFIEKEEATGRPVSLLSQFLLNRSKFI